MINAIAAPWNYRPMTMTGCQGHACRPVDSCHQFQPTL